jgi:cytochrome b involved in lipid metabolism
MDFHPGGDTELMRGVGQDGTNLFNQVGSATVRTRNAHKNYT